MQNISTDQARAGDMVQIGDRNYLHVGRGVCKRALPPDQEPSEDADALTGHPNPAKRRRGWRVEWVFLLVVLLLLCISLPLLAAVV